MRVVEKIEAETGVDDEEKPSRAASRANSRTYKEIVDGTDGEGHRDPDKKVCADTDIEVSDDNGNVALKEADDEFQGRPESDVETKHFNCKGILPLKRW